MAVNSEDIQKVEELLRSDADVNQQDEYGWTALHQAAGKGNLDLVRMLVEKGADLLKADKEQRNAYAVALAAGRVDVAAYLQDVMKEITGEKTPRKPRPYCKAYYLQDLRKYPDWSENKISGKSNGQGNGDDRNLSADSIVFIHQDHTVTASMWHDEDVIFNVTNPDWIDFCSRELGFKVPGDLELIA